MEMKYKTILVKMSGCFILIKKKRTLSLKVVNVVKSSYMNHVQFLHPLGVQTLHVLYG
jgi:hypothetical protein